MSAKAARMGARLGAIGLVIGGGALAAAGLWAPAKAAMGQLLLDRAFEQRAAAPDANPARPWPWADMAPEARFHFPSLGEERLVLDTASGEAMAWGPGHVSGTAPFGAPGVSAAAAHRDTHFALLGRLGPGDPIEIETLSGERFAYRVVGAQVVDAERWRFPHPPATGTDAPDILALSTCWPLGSTEPGPERLIVLAERVPAR